MEYIFESDALSDLQEDNPEILLQQNFLQRYTKTQGVEDHGKEFEKAVCMLYALKLLTDDDIFDFNMTSNNKAYGIFDDMALDVTFKNDTKCMFLFQLKYREDKEPITQQMLTKKTQQLDKNHVKSKFYLPNYVDTINSLDIEDKEVVNILYTNRPVAVDNARTISFKSYAFQVLQCEEVENEKLILNKQFEKNNFLKFAPIVDPESKERAKLEKACRQFFVLSEDNSLTTIHDSVRDHLSDLLNCDVYGLYEHFMRNWWADNFVLTKDYLITKLSEIALLHDVKTISALRHNEKTEIIKEAIMQFGVTMVDESQEDVVRGIWPEADDPCQIQDFPTYLMPGCEVFAQKALMLWVLGKVPMIVKIDGTNKKTVLSVVRLLQRSIESKSVVLLGNRNKGDFEGFV